MATWLKIAFRNLIKNARRSLITIFAISFGFAAVCLFAGFMEYMYAGNRDVTIYAGASGHLSIFKKGFLEAGQLDPARFLISSEEISKVEEICRGIPEVLLVTPQLKITGLLTNGKVSTIFIGMGTVPSSTEVFLNGMKRSLQPKMKQEFLKQQLDPDNMYGVGVAMGLAKLLDLKVGASAVTFTNTVDGQMNALDVEVLKIFNAGSELMNDKIMRVSLDFARTLYDTDGADRLAILLRDTEKTDAVAKEIKGLFEQKGLELDVRTWEEMSEWYRRVKELFDVIFAFLFVIVFIIVLMSVVNTMSMAVFERTREIGTLRALGLKCRGVLSLFTIESIMLGFLGTLAGLLMTFLGWWLTGVFRPTWTPPGMTARVAINIEAVPLVMVYAFVFMLVLCFFASIIPARRAAKQNIVDALGHV